MNQFSSSFNGKEYENPVPTQVMQAGSFSKMMRGYFSKPKTSRPLTPPGLFYTDPAVLGLPPAGLRVTWMGHSTVLLDVDGRRMITDPVWARRASPFLRIGPRRFFDPPIPLEALPPIDAVLLSHNHYDHLDKKAIRFLAGRNIPVFTFLGVGKQLVRWGIDPSLVTELDWWQSLTPFPGFTLTGLPARHFSGRWLHDRFHTLWGSFAIKGPQHHVYFGADSGYYEGFKAIGEALGPFDLTLLDTGAYNELWKEIHMGPDYAVQAHIDLKGKLLMPIHWGTFDLAMHPWTEPVERVIRAASLKGVPLLLPTPGATVEAVAPHHSGWWLKK